MSYRWLIILTLSLLLLLMHSWDAEGACRRQMDEDDSSEDAIGWLIILTLSLLLLLMHSWDAEGACRRQSSGRRMQMDEDDSSEDAIENAVQQRVSLFIEALLKLLK
ncbi:hypothetical protein ACLKA7_004611 [Drosophila subpalustris]